MISTNSGFSQKAKNTINVRRGLTAVAGLLALGALCVGTKADAAQVHFRFVGGHWSHSYHSGWHRYWGGPSVGFYYAPSPVYVVPGYSGGSYYSGPDFWYSNPSFGLSIDLGGGGGGYYRYGGHYYTGGHYDGHHYVGGGHNFTGGQFYGGSTQRSHSDGGNSHQGGHSNHGGHSGRGGDDRHR